MYWHKPHTILLSKAVVFVILSVTSWSVAFAECAISRHVQVPNIYGLSYDAAREQLIRAGWQPTSNMNQAGGPASSDILSGNGEIFWKRGYFEVESCAGTGPAQCLFTFSDIYNNKLKVITSGEEAEIKGKGYHAKVQHYELACK